MTTQRKTVGLALGSGGVRGMAHVGVIRTFLKHGIPMDFFAGSSVGAWVGAHYALYQDIDRLIDDTVGKRREKMKALFEPTLKGGLVKGRKVEKLLTLFLADSDFSALRAPLAVVATDLRTGMPVVFREGKLAPAVRASIAIPTFFQPVLYEGQLLVDGGISDPVPSDLVRSMGADIVVAINLNVLPPQTDRLANGDLKLTGVSTRTLDIMRHWLAEQAVRNADVVIAPSIVYAGLKTWGKYFTSEVGRQIMEQGADAAEAAVPEILQLLRD
ncbi:MAG: patatin-like phospholipase family protein [Patescibacteria group bacterium]|jgi:NTE family protein